MFLIFVVVVVVVVVGVCDGLWTGVCLMCCPMGLGCR